MDFYWKLNRRIFTFLTGGAIVLVMVTEFSQPARAQTVSGEANPQAAKKPLPNLTLPTLDGKKWSLNEQRGRVVLINFWATWCLPCHEEVPVLISLSEKYKKDGLEIVGISINSDQLKEIKRFVAEFKVSYPVLLPNPDSLLAKREAVPMTLLIDEKGYLVEKIVGAADENFLETEIKKLLVKPSPQKTKKASGAEKKIHRANYSFFND